MYIKNVTKDHDVRQNQLAMGKYLENIFSGKQTREMESITLPVSCTEQSLTTTWDGMPCDFLHRPMGICTKKPPSFLRMFARVTLWCVN
jgi:hypothetical protein